MTSQSTLTLWTPVGPEELELIRQSAMRLPAKASRTADLIPVLSEDYATKIIHYWYVPHSGGEYATRFEVPQDFLDRYKVQEAGGRPHFGYILADGLDTFNSAIVGDIVVTGRFFENPAESGLE